MTLSGINRGSGNDNTAATSVAISPTSNFNGGTMAVLVLAYDNSGAAGIDPFSTITDNDGNVWTSRMAALFDPGAASAGVTLRIFTAFLNSGALGTSDVITVSFGANSTTAKSWALIEVQGSTGTPTFGTQAAGTGATTGTPTITTSSITSGDMVVGGGAAESADTWAGDADATNGSWSTHQHNAAGTGATGMSVTAQYKVVTGTATQTYNPTLTSVDVILGWISITDAANPALVIASVADLGYQGGGGRAVVWENDIDEEYWNYYENPTAPHDVGAQFAPAVTLSNTHEGGSDGTLITTGNSGGASGDAYDVVTQPSGSNQRLAFSDDQKGGSFAADTHYQGQSDTAETFGWSTKIGSQNRLFIRYYLYLTTFPATNNLLPRLDVPGTTNEPDILIGPAGTLVVENSTGSNRLTSQVLPTEKWIRVEVMFHRSVSGKADAELRWYSDPNSGTPTQSLVTGGTETMGTADYVGVIFAPTSSASNPSMDIYIDDVAVSTENWPGPSATTFPTTERPSLVAYASIPGDGTVEQTGDPDEEHHNWYSMRLDGSVETFIAGPPIAGVDQPVSEIGERWFNASGANVSETGLRAPNGITDEVGRRVRLISTEVVATDDSYIATTWPLPEQDTAYQADPDEEHYNWYAQRLDGSVEAFIAGAPAVADDAYVAALDLPEQETPYQADVDDEHYNFYAQRLDGSVEAFIAGPPVADDSYVATIDVFDDGWTGDDYPEQHPAEMVDGTEAVLGFLTVEDTIANAAQLDAAAGQDDDALWTLVDPTDIAPFIEQAEAIVGFLTVEDEIAEAAQLDRSVGQDDDQAWVAGDPTDVAPFVDGAEAILGFLTVEDEIAEAAQLPRDIGWFPEDFEQTNDPTDIAPFVEANEEYLAGPPTFADDGYAATVDVFDHSDQPAPDDAFDFYATTQEGTEWLIGFLPPDVEIAIGAQPSRGEDTGTDNPDWDYTTDQPYVEQTEAVVGFLAPDAEITEAAQLDRSVGQDDDQAWIAGDPTDTTPFLDGAEAVLGFLVPSDEIAQASQPAPDLGWFPEDFAAAEDPTDAAPFTDQGEAFAAGPPASDDFIATVAPHVESVAVDFPERIDDTEEQSVETAHVQPEEYIAGSTVADDPVYLAQQPAPDLGWSPEDYPEYEQVSIDAAGVVDVSTIEAYTAGPPASLLPAYDSFNRPDAGALGTSDSGHLWTDSTGVFTIASGQAVETGGVADPFSTIDIGVTDQQIEADAVSPSQQQHLAVRVSGNGANALIAGWQSGANFVFMFRRVAGSYTQLGSSVDVGKHTGRLRLEAVGTTINLYVDDVLVISQTDSLVPLATRCGLFGRSAAFDNFNALNGAIATYSLPEQAWFPEQETEDYANDATLDATAPFFPPAADDSYIATTAVVPDVSDQPAPDEAWDGYAYPVEASEWFIGFLAPDAAIADGAQDHTVGQDDDQAWTLLDPTDAAPFVDGIEYLTGFLVPADEIAQAAQPHYGDWQDWREAEQTEDYANDSTIGVEDTTSSPDAFDLTIATQPDPSIGQDDDALWTITDPTVGEDQPFVDETEWLTGFLTVEDEIAEAAQLDRSVGQDDDATWTGTDPTDIAPFVDGVEALTRPDDAFSVTIATQLGTDVGHDLDLLFPPDLSQLDTGYVEQAEGYVAGPPAFAPDAEAIAAQPAETGIDVEGRWPEWDGTDATPFLDGAEWFIGFTVPDVEITIATQPTRAEDVAVDNPDRVEWTEETDPGTTLDLSPLTFPPDSTDTTFAAQLDPSAGQDDDQSWIAADPTDVWPFTDQLEAFGAIVLPDEGIAATQDYADDQHEPEAPWAPESLADGAVEFLASDSEQATFAAAGALSEPASEPEDEAWPLYVPLADQSGEFAATQLDIALVAALDLTPAPVDEPEVWTPESTVADGVEQLALDAEIAVTVAAQPTFEAYDWTTFEEPVADLTTVERRPTPLQPTARPEIVEMIALVDPGVDLVALKDPEVGFPEGGGFSSGFSSGFARGGGTGELDALAETAPDAVPALANEVEQIDALSDPQVDVT